MQYEKHRIAPRLRGPGVWESVKEFVRGEVKSFDVVQLEVSSACPARCAYCPHTSMQKVWRSEFMSTETYAAAWPLFRASCRVHLQGWGEPLLHERFFDFVELARRADCRVSTTSCGLLMDEDIALRLVKSGVDIIAFSLAGTDEVGNKSRQGAPFSRVCAAIEQLQKIRKRHMAAHLEVRLAYLLLASQTDGLYALPDLLDALDAHAAVVSTMDFIAAPEMACEAFMPWEREKISRAKDALEKISAEAAQRGRAVYYSLPADVPGAACLEHIERSLYVAANGDISPCIYVNLPTTTQEAPRRVFGNVNHGEPLKVWENTGFRAFRQGLAEFRPDENCVNCPKRFAAKVG